MTNPMINRRRADTSRRRQRVRTILEAAVAAGTQISVAGIARAVEELDQELDAARAANRELFANMNTRHGRGGVS